MAPKLFQLITNERISWWLNVTIITDCGNGVPDRPVQSRTYFSRSDRVHEADKRGKPPGLALCPCDFARPVSFEDARAVNGECRLRSFGPCLLTAGRAGQPR